MAKHISYRDLNCERLKTLTAPDVLILGGGVNGIAVLRELALNGVSAVLLEEGDFVGGASGVSTRMAHGGLRYLENREFALVKEAVRERNLLLKNAPHMVSPQEFILPVRQRVRGYIGGVLSFLGFNKGRISPNYLALKSALMLYEFFGRANRSLPRHRTSLTRRGLPKNIDATFKGYVAYFDGKIENPEGLIFEMLEEALHASEQTAALNYCKSTMEKNGTFAIKDRLTGALFHLQPKLIINATGAWLDATNAKLALNTNYVSAVKGAQIIVRHPGLKKRLGDRAFYYADPDNRLVICNPLSETILMGTTEIVVDDPSRLQVEAREREYLLKALSGLFDDIEVTDKHIVSVITGARPLRNASDGDAYNAKREHAVLADKTPNGTPVLSMVGGKWTTFRPFAEEATERALRYLQRPKTVSTKDRVYRGTPLPETQRPEPSDTRAHRLFERYGAIWQEVAAFCEAGQDWSLTHASTYSKREVIWLIEQRGAVYLDDIILRRTQIALNARATEAALMEIALILAEAAGKDKAWAEAETSKCKAMPAIRFQASGYAVP